MAERQLNRLLLMLGAATALLTIGSNLISVGQIKGELLQAIGAHEARLDRHDTKLENLGEGVAELKARLHGVASQVGKLPGQVAAKLQETDHD